MSRFISDFICSKTISTAFCPPALSAGGQTGIESVLQKMKDEIYRNMTLMGCKTINDLNRSKVVFR